MSTMIPDLVVGEVGFGNNFAPEADFYRDQCRRHELEIKDLKAELAAARKDIRDLRHLAKRCAALAPDISHEKHEILLRTAPKNN